MHDAHEQRGKRGFLFTVGDEPVLDGVTRDQMTRVLGIDMARDLSGIEAARLASETYDCFHIIVDGSYARRSMREVRASWERVLPGRVLYLAEQARMAELIVGTIELVADMSGARATGAAGIPPASGLVATEVRRRPWGER